MAPLFEQIVRRYRYVYNYKDYSRAIMHLGALNEASGERKKFWKESRKKSSLIKVHYLITALIKSLLRKHTIMLQLCQLVPYIFLNYIVI